MPSTTRGSILISTANDIGSTLVDKLGGDGYTPEEWDSAANLCGIASADIATALSNIQESTPGGADRGSISIAKANSIGRILNKKFDTSRGFKPSEWASAISKLTPLEIKTASGAIASFSDGADGVPVKSCSVSFLPSGGGGTPSSPVAISGVSGLSVTRAGKNLLNPTYLEDGYSLGANGLPTLVAKRIATTTPVPIHGGNITISYSTSVNTVQFMYATFVNGTLIERVAGKANGSTINAQNADEIYISLYDTQSSDITGGSVVTNVQVEVGSTATTYSAYVTPSVVTDTFGQTIYGGTRDLTTDKASVTYDLFDMGDFTWNVDTGRQGVFYTSNITEADDTLFALACTSYIVDNTKNPNTIPDYYLSSMGSYGKPRIFIKNPDFIGYTGAQVKSALEGVKVVLRLATPTEITGFTPHEIDTLYGDNNIYADTGTTEVEYRADIDLALNA